MKGLPRAFTVGRNACAIVVACAQTMRVPSAMKPI
jgi:hypothetical protein